MTIQKSILTLTLWPFLMVQTCAKDSEENNDEDVGLTVIQYTEDEEVTREMAIENWEMFVRNSQEAIENIEVNIGNLEMQADETALEQKQDIQEIVDSCNLSLIKLKAKRHKRNQAFEKELNNYSREVYEKNADFELHFSTEIENINSKLRNLRQKIRSGYYK